MSNGNKHRSNPVWLFMSNLLKTVKLFASKNIWNEDVLTNIYKKIRAVPIFSRRRSKSIVDKIVSLLLVWGLLIYLLAIAGIWWGSSKVIEDNFRNQAVDWIKKLDELGTPLYAGENQALFRSIEDHVSRFPELSYLRYYDNEKKEVIAEYRSEYILETNINKLDALSFDKLQKRTDKDKPLFIHTADSDLSLIQAVSPIIVRSIQSDSMLDFDLESDQKEKFKIIGFIEIGLDFGLYRKQLIDNLLVGSLIIAISFILAAVLGRTLIKRALKPLINLRMPLDKLARGDIDVRVESEGDEEVVAIANALNTTITALKNRDKKLQKLANFDPLTGLLNKHNFHLQLKQEMEHITKQGDSSALMFIDLDQFKHVNDNLGHAAGDRLLSQVAELLKNRMRQDDVLSRFGGDEFTVIARSVNSSEAELIASSIVKSMQDFVFSGGDQSFNIFCSIGVVMIKPDQHTIDEIFSQADMACFQAKSKGRNRYHMFDAVEQEEVRIASDIGWSKRIKDALVNDYFSLYFQPIIGLIEDDVEHYEALLRLCYDNGEVLAPSAFLSAAERLGFAVEIDYWVIRHAFAQVQKFNKQGKRISLAINLSGRVFDEPDLVDKVQDALEKYEIDSQDIIFEITEQTAISKIDRAQRRINDLMKLGFRFALDDFGVGFSSFNYLKQLPVDYLKIDGSFVVDMANDPVDQAMVKSMIQIAGSLGKKTIAEHVEDKAALEMLKEFGADYAQGYFIGKPMPECHYEKYEEVLQHTASNVIKFEP